MKDESIVNNFSLSDEIEDKIKKIPGVLGCNLFFDGDELREVHILADLKRPAKDIMLDAKSVIVVTLNSSFDFRKISVARIDTEAESFTISRRSSSLMPANRVILIASYTKRAEGNKFQGVVELKIKGEIITGTATGVLGESSVHELIGRAFSDAIRNADLKITVFPRIEMVSSYCVAEVLMISDDLKEHQSLVGTVRLSGDTPMDVSRAILQAINRQLELMIRQI